jgi:sugar/nucleoside kinase (ribokinase family)
VRYLLIAIFVCFIAGLTSIAVAPLSRIAKDLCNKPIVVVGSIKHIDAFPVMAADTTAAGDAFNGAFAVGLIRGDSPENSARFATAAAAIYVTRSGAQSSLSNHDEVLSLLNRHG